MHQFGSKDKGQMEFPGVVTIFSAPNYCQTYDNKGAYILLDHGRVMLKQFSETPAPYQLPNGLNVFSWSAPFLADRVLNMFSYLLLQAAESSSKYSSRD